jgi:hypothetical protein
MTGTSLQVLQAAIYARLTTDVESGGLFDPSAPMITGVLDDVPDGQGFPYITIGEATENAWSTMGRDGSNDTLTIHIWSSAPGFKEALTILDRLNVLLDGGVLEIDGHMHVGTLYESAETLRDPDGVTRHVVARYRVYVQVS